MIKFEIPYNLDPAYPEKLLQRPALIPYIDCIYAAAWKDDCDNTRFDITFRSDYPKTYEEYVERIKSLLALGIPVCILAQKKTTITMIRKYRALGIHQFILNDDKLAARIKQEYPEVRLTLSITRALTLSELQTGDYSMYDRIVLFHWFARHLEALQQLPTGYQYTMIANSACYHDCKWHDEHWFLKGDTPENYAKESERVCSSCTALLSKGKQQSAYIEPEDLRYFDPYAGFYTDSKWEANYKGAKAAGIPIGAYYFVGKDCVTAAAGKADAERFLKILKGKQLEYPVYMDNEAQPASAKVGITEATIAFCETMESAGYFVGIYGSAVSGFKERMDDTKLTPYAHWVAQYASKCSYKGNYGIWQYSSKGSVDGISGNVDLDYGYVDYPAIIKSGGFNGYTKDAFDDNTPCSSDKLPA